MSRHRARKLKRLHWHDPEAVVFAACRCAGRIMARQFGLRRMSWRVIVLSRLAPYEMLRFMRLHEAAQGLAAIAGETSRAKKADLWRDLPPEIDAQIPPFRGGAAGLFGYDLGPRAGARISVR